MVVNCSGLGARLLGADRTVVPVRGQVVYVEQFGLDRWWLDGAGPTYVVPRAHDVVVGGTDEEGDWSRTPSPGDRRGHPAPGRRAGAGAARRPGAAAQGRAAPGAPRRRAGAVGDVIHCYGHGGAGVTLSWGCADEVVALVVERLGVMISG